MNRHCYNCGWDYTLDGQPGRSESCHQCDSDLKVCLNCKNYDAKVAHQCRESRAEPVAEKGSANYCEYFEFVKRKWKEGKKDSNSREEEARDRMRKLFGD